MTNDHRARSPLAGSRPLALACLTTFLLGFALILGTSACSPPAASEHAGHGEAIDVDPAARTITLDHEDIPGLMKGMTMTFAVAPEVDLGSIAPGAEVDFRLKSEGSALTVTEVRPASP